MLVEFRRLDGKPISVESSVIFRLRPSGLHGEPGSGAAIDVGNLIYVEESYGEAIGKLASVLPLAQLTSPIRTAVSVSSRMVRLVTHANPSLDHPDARAAVILGPKRQAVLETQQAARALIEASLSV